MHVRRYPGRDSNPHATKAVALKATVSDQFHHPGGSAEASDNTPSSQVFGGLPGRRFSFDTGIRSLLGSPQASAGRHSVAGPPEETTC